MAEETTATATTTAATTATSTEATTQTATAQTTESSILDFIEKDGSLKGDWSKNLVPEDYQNLGEFKTISNIKDVFRSVGTLSRLKGKQGKGIFPPDDKSLPTEVDDFYRALGRPDTPDGYQITAPKELESVIDKSITTELATVCHAAGLSPKQAAVVANAYFASTQKAVADAKTQQEARYAAGLEELTKRWGAAVPERTQIVQNILREYMLPSDKDAVEHAINENPAIADLLSSIGKRFMEGKAPNLGEGNTGMTPAEADNALKEAIAEQAKDPYMRQKNPGKFARLNADIKRFTALSMGASPE
jgi:hypothetical protein